MSSRAGSRARRRPSPKNSCGRRRPGAEAEKRVAPMPAAKYGCACSQPPKGRVPPMCRYSTSASCVSTPSSTLGGLARIPELVEAVVALAVAQFQRHGEARAVLEIAVVAGVLVFEAAAHAVAAVQARPGTGAARPPRASGSGEPEGGGSGEHRRGSCDTDYRIRPAVRHCEHESFALAIVPLCA